MIKINPVVKYEGWNVYESVDSYFRAVNDGKYVRFRAEYKNGLNFHIIAYFDGKRCYMAHRYFYKLIPLIRELSFELLKAGKLWDYQDQRPALETYKKDIAPYYHKCKESGLPLYEDAEFLENLFA